MGFMNIQTYFFHNVAGIRIGLMNESSCPCRMFFITGLTLAVHMPGRRTFTDWNFASQYIPCILYMLIVIGFFIGEGFASLMKSVTLCQMADRENASLSSLSS
jgi:hypothetical protein